VVRRGDGEVVVAVSVEPADLGGVGQHEFLRLLVEALRPVEPGIRQGSAHPAEVVHHVAAADDQHAVLP
jgi:hypothetical protein